MKILFITDLYPVNTGESTTPVTLHNFVSAWIKQGHEVSVIKPNFIFNSFLRQKPFYKTGKYNYEGVEIYNINYFTPFLFDIEDKLSVDVASYEVIIAHMPSGIIFANKLAKKYNKPLVCGVHRSDLEVLINPIYGIYFKGQMEDAYTRAKKIACRSHVLQKKFNRLIPELSSKTFVAPSGIDFNEDVVKQNEYLVSVLTCANLIKRKNVDKLISAIKDLDGFKLNVIGDGKEYRNLKQLGAECNNIDFLGRLSHEKVLEEMEKADIFLLSSVDETFGMVYLEAMASGCITICTKGDGIDGIIIDNENGFLCEPTVAGVKEVLSKIKTFTKENLDKIREKSLETVKKYSIENCASSYIDNLR